MNWLLTKGLQYIGAKFDGHKTKIGGMGLIITGLLGVITLIWPDAMPGAPEMSLEQIIAAVTGGFAVLGIGGKIDKNTAAVKEAGNGTQPQSQQGSIVVDSVRDANLDLP